jgi:putative ABC transport system permease protein
VWNKYFHADPFNYFFLDDYFNQQYSADQLFENIWSLRISCNTYCLFGLLGLSAYNVLQRTKEIGIRKILGASTQNLLFLLSKDFLLLVLLAFVIATPVAWWVMHNWLQGFAYRVSIYWWVFVAAGIISVLIALTTISFQAVKAAIANPVKSLRTE